MFLPDSFPREQHISSQVNAKDSRYVFIPYKHFLMFSRGGQARETSLSVSARHKSLATGAIESGGVVVFRRHDRRTVGRKDSAGANP